MDEIIDGINPYEAFSKICKANGEFSLGLYRRRMDEAVLSSIFRKFVSEKMK